MKTGLSGMKIVVGLMFLALFLAFVGPKLINRQVAAPEQHHPASNKSSFAARGLVESVTEIVLSSQVKSTIRKIHASEGELVKKGQLLVEFDSGKVRAQYDQALASLSQAQARYRELQEGYRSEDVGIARAGKQRAEAIHHQAKDEHERQARLYEKGAATLLDLNRAKERLRVAEEQLSEADLNAGKMRTGVRREELLQGQAVVAQASADVRYAANVLHDYRIQAPISGLITERFKEAGEGVDLGTPVLRLIDISRLRIRAELEESDVGKVTIGKFVEVTTDAYPGKVYTGKVDNVLPVVRKKAQKNFDPMASFDINTQEIHIQLSDYTGLKEGMTVTVRLK